MNIIEEIKAAIDVLGVIPKSIYLGMNKLRELNDYYKKLGFPEYNHISIYNLYFRVPNGKMMACGKRPDYASVPVRAWVGDDDHISAGM